MKNNILKHAVLNALATAFYIFLVASFLFYAPKIFGPDRATNTALVPIAMLLLFVFSAAFTGLLMFGKPVLLYLDGKKQEALSLLVSTLEIFLVITLASFVILFVYLAR